MISLFPVASLISSNQPHRYIIFVLREDKYLLLLLVNANRNINSLQPFDAPQSLPKPAFFPLLSKANSLKVNTIKEIFSFKAEAPHLSDHNLKKFSSFSRSLSRGCRFV